MLHQAARRTMAQFSFYSDIRMIGKNYKIRSYENLNITRNYTVSNVMESTYYRLVNEALLSND